MKYTPFAVGLSAVVILGGFFARPSIVEAVAGGAVHGARLESPASYRVLAPVSGVLDSLTLLSMPQLLCTLAFVCVVAALIRLSAMRARARAELPAFRASEQFRFGARTFGGMIAVCGLGLIAPRPMAAIRVEDPDVVAVDFHSHTSASHDGLSSFTPETNREWHRKAGFDVAYITDHHTFAGANAATLSNRTRAGGGVVLLPGLEYLDHDEHLLAIGLDTRTTDPQRREWRPVSGACVRSVAGAPPLLILALPANLERIPAGEETGCARLTALEISDGSPRGLEQQGSELALIRALAARYDLAMVSGSDNHGWGNTAPAWTLLRIPGWRAMSPAQLDVAIRRTLFFERAGATRVVMRRLPNGSSPMWIGFTGPQLAVELVRDLGWDERVSWLAWTWGVWLVLAFFARRRAGTTVRGLRWSRSGVPAWLAGGTAPVGD